MRVKVRIRIGFQIRVGWGLQAGARSSISICLHSTLIKPKILSAERVIIASKPFL